MGAEWHANRRSLNTRRTYHDVWWSSTWMPRQLFSLLCLHWSTPRIVLVRSGSCARCQGRLDSTRIAANEADTTAAATASTAATTGNFGSKAAQTPEKTSTISCNELSSETVSSGKDAMILINVCGNGTNDIHPILCAANGARRKRIKPCSQSRSMLPSPFWRPSIASSLER